MSRSISEPLADDTHKGALGSLHVIYAEPDAIAIAEVEFAQIAVQMALIAVLVDALRATFEDAVKALKGVGVNLAAHVFAFAMVYAFMACELSTDRFVMARRPSLGAPPCGYSRAGCLQRRRVACCRYGSCGSSRDVRQGLRSG